MEFYKNAVELRCALSGFVMQEKYIPKKWRPILTYPTVNLLNTMMEHIIAANGIYPYSGGKLDHELLHRRKELQAQAVADCEALFDRLQFIMDQRLNALAKNFVDAPNLERLKYGQPTKENGLYIGPEDSQIFAIAYPNSIDHTIKDQWRQRWFARYMDDSYIINKSKELLIEFRRLLFGLFAEKGIVPNPKKTQIVKLRRGFTYLKTKFTLLPNGKVLQQPCRESVIRERRKIKKFFNFLQAGLMTIEQILTSYMSWRGSLIKKQARRSVHCTDLLFFKLYGIMPWKIKSKRKSKARHIQWKNLLNASTPSMPKSPPLKAC